MSLESSSTLEKRAILSRHCLAEIETMQKTFQCSDITRLTEQSIGKYMAGKVKCERDIERLAQPLEHFPERTDAERKQLLFQYGFF